MNETYNPEMAAEAQERYCEETERPMFAPLNGYCYNCGLNIYEQHKSRRGGVSGYTVEYASTKLVTNCPHCNWSFLE